jgi:hypothetical protein
VPIWTTSKAYIWVHTQSVLVTRLAISTTEYVKTVTKTHLAAFTSVIVSMTARIKKHTSVIKNEQVDVRTLRVVVAVTEV